MITVRLLKFWEQQYQSLSLSLIIEKTQSDPNFCLVVIQYGKKIKKETKTAPNLCFGHTIFGSKMFEMEN